MSNISGNTFFIENSVNCSDLGSLNGQVTFIDCSINCGQVLNAIFSGVAGVNTPYNYGQVYGCTIFSDSYNYGYVCGTGILRGTSRLYGGADCVILCDQSTIDPSAEVTDYELLVNYSTPVNCYSLDSCYYTYSNGVATLATGGWSNGFYCNGDRQTVLQYIGNQFYPCAIQGADTLAWYTYNQYLGGNGVQCADGNYYNASISSENLNQISSPFIYPIIDWFADCIYGPRGCGYVIYESGLSIGELNGIYATSGCPLPELKRLNCNEFNSCWFSNVTETIAMHQPFPFLIENSNQIYSCGNEYVLIDSSFNCIVNCTGTYSIGVFGETTSNCYCIYYWCASCGYSVLKLNETIQTPRPAINDNAYYTYCTGVPSLASGLYSNFAINGGVIDTTYCNYAPNNESQDGCCLPFIYTDGCAYSAVDCDTIFENCVFYSSSSEVANESFKNFYTDPTYFGVLNSQQRGIYSNFTAYPTFCLNYLFSYKCLGNMCDSAIIYCGNGQFVFVCSSFPFFEHKIQRNNIDIATPINLCNSQTNQYYFIVCGGSTSFATGAYSNYYFNNDGTILASACTTPQEAQDCTGLYYEYTSIGCACGAFGAYSNYYFDPFYSIDTSYSCAVPLQVAKDSSCYFLYISGSAIIGNGAFSNYVFNNGNIYIDYTLLTPCCAFDNGCYYVYNSGAAVCLAEGLFTNGCFNGGLLNQMPMNGSSIQFITPEQTLDNPLIYVGFNMNGGGSFLPNGIYRNFAFINGCINQEYNCLLPQYPLDMQICYTLYANLGLKPTYYTYISGSGSTANGYYSDGHYSEGVRCPMPSACFITGAIDDCKFYCYINQFVDGTADQLAFPYLVTGCRNDVPGYDASPSGAYDFGNAGEYNPNPCFYEYKNGPYTYTYYCEDIPNSATGIVPFAFTSVCCGPDAGCVTCGRNVWLYDSTVSCCGYDPINYGFRNYGENELLNCSLVQRDTFCSTSSNSNQCCTYCYSRACCVLWLINYKLYSDLHYGGVFTGPYYLYQGSTTYWECCDLFCADYCTCNFDLYCTCYYDIFDENANCIGQDSCQVCCGSDSCQVCCGQSCCGGEVICDCVNTYICYANFDANGCFIEICAYNEVYVNGSGPTYPTTSYLCGVDAINAIVSNSNPYYNIFNNLNL